MVSWCMPVTESMPVPYESDLVTEWWDNEPSGWVGGGSGRVPPTSFHTPHCIPVGDNASFKHALKIAYPSAKRLSLSHSIRGQNNA